MNLKSQLLLHAGETAHPIRFAYAPCQLSNKEYCDTLRESLSKAFDSKWECKRATPNLHETLPNIPGLYMFVWAPEFYFAFDNYDRRLYHILYIGKTGSEGSETIKTRYQKGYSKLVGSNPESLWNSSEDKNREARLTRCLNLNEVQYWYLPFSGDPKNTRSAISDYEKRLIVLLSPPGNKQFVKASLSKPAPAF